MLEVTSSPAGDHWNADGRTNGGGQLNIVTILGSVRIHAGQQDFPSAPSLDLLRPFHDIQIGPIPAPMRVDSPLTWSRSLGVDGDHDTLNAESLGRTANQFWFLDCRGVDAHFIGSRQQHLPDICGSSNTSPDRERHKTLFGRAPHYVDHRSPIVRRGRDIEKNEFIGLLAIVFHRAFHRIPSVAQLQKLRSFHDPAISDIEARNDSFSQHLSEIKSASRFQPRLRGPILLSLWANISSPTESNSASGKLFARSLGQPEARLLIKIS